VEVGGCLVEAGFFGKRGGVDDEDYAADGFGVRELGGRVVAQLAMAGGVEEEEAARTLVGWVAGGAVVGGGGDVGAWEEGFDGEGLCGCVRLRDGVAFGLGWLAWVVRSRR
jgi:hypothetical protein